MATQASASSLSSLLLCALFCFSGARGLSFSAATPGTDEYIHNSPWTDDEVLAFSQPTYTTAAQRAKGLIPSDLATRYSGFVSRVGTWQPSDSPFYWNFNTQSRAEAQDAYWTIVDPAYATKCVWTGSAANYDAGTTNQEFRDAVYRYINYNRYLYHGSKVRYVFEDAAKLKLVQEAALIQFLNPSKFSHEVTSDWIGYNDLARQGSANSNLYSHGDGATIDDWAGYFVDFGNSIPGHRIWLLLPYAFSAAVGVAHDSAGSNAFDATWIDGPSGFDFPTTERDPLQSAAYYPYPGYVPSTLLSKVMNDDGVLSFSVSFTSPNCFGNNSCKPTITVKRDGVVLPVISQLWSGQDLIYKVDIADHSLSGTKYYNQFSTDYFGSDQKYEVTIDGVWFPNSWTTPKYLGDDYWVAPAALTPRSVSYSFTVFNPSKNVTEAISPKSQVYGLSTRAKVGSGDSVLIGGLNVTGTEPMRVILRAQGTSLKGVNNPAKDLKIEIHQLSADGASSRLMGANDSWKEASNWRMVESYGFAPGATNEAAVIASLAPGLYTVTVSDKANGGVGLIEMYSVDTQTSTQMFGVSSRGIMGTDEDSMISGFVLQKETTVVVTAKGPSMSKIVQGTVADPKLHVVRMSDGVTIADNDDWNVAGNERLKSDLAWAAPSDSHEAARVLTLPAGAYSVVCESKGDAGVGIVEVYRGN
jgi:hypothetical protein